MKSLTPKQANTYKKICSMPRTYWNWPNHWILFEENVVSIVNQKTGESPKGGVTIPRKVFESMIRVYEKGKK